MRRAVVIGLMWCWLFLPAYAWDISGHKLVAEIAFLQLKPKARKRVKHLLHVFNHQHHGIHTFQSMAAWPDFIKFQGHHEYDTWHYINLAGEQKPSQLTPPHIVSAIQVLRAELHQSSLPPDKQALDLSILAHLYGDIHQPFHCFSHPGDPGGLNFAIDSPVADNLHAFWDRGLGLWRQQGHHHKILRKAQVHRLAQEWSAQYQPSHFKSALLDEDPRDWALHSHALAKKAYQLDIASRPSESYTQRGQQRVIQQIVLAGYRLANELNQLWG